MFPGRLASSAALVPITSALKSKEKFIMSPKTKKVKKQVTRIVNAPTSSTINSLPQNRVISVELKKNQDVQWIWSYTSSGQSYVSGYEIIEEDSVPTKKK
jgi:hypothetical protein